MTDDPAEQITEPEPPDEVDELTDEELEAAPDVDDAEPVEDDPAAPTTEVPE